MPLIGGTQILELGVANQTVPKQGPRAIPIRADFTVEQTYELDLSLQNNMAIMNDVQGMFVDNSANTEQLTIFVSSLLQTIVIPPFSQGYVPILATTPTKLILNTTGGVVVQFHFLNMPMPLHIWGVGSSSFNLDANGFVETSNPALDALITGGGLNVNYLADARRPPNFAVNALTITTATSNILFTTTQRVYCERFVLSISGNCTRAVAGATRLTLQSGTEIVWRGAIWVPAVAGTTPELYSVDVPNMNYLCPVGGNLTLFFDTAFNAGNIYAQAWCGSQP